MINMWYLCPPIETNWRRNTPGCSSARWKLEIKEALVSQRAWRWTWITKFRLKGEVHSEQNKALTSISSWTLFIPLHQQVYCLRQLKAFSQEALLKWTRQNMKYQTIFFKRQPSTGCLDTHLAKNLATSKLPTHTPSTFFQPQHH